MVVTIKMVPVVLMLGMSTILAGCSEFQTSYSSASPAAARTEWRVAKVRVIVPDSLKATEENSFIPAADIVWHGDPAGDRKAQVAAIVQAGVEQGFAGLKGRESVVATVTLRRFHALTPRAFERAPSGTGVHSVRFDLQINDARTGALLAGPVTFDADTPAYVAADIKDSTTINPGRMWKAQIERHVADTIRSWLGTGPDVRQQFGRAGG
ncbi:MAG: hypothetical protein QM656_00730 [Paracoccaceae bacterium]